MHDKPAEFHRLDELMTAHPPAAGPEDLPALVMHRIAAEPPVVPFWQYHFVQWLAASIGLFFTLGRLLSYIFSAWLSIELAG